MKKGAGIVFIDNNLIGLGLRGDNVPAPNMWCSIGGKLEINETEIEAAIRETFEETNIVVDKNQLNFLNTFVEDNGFIYTTYFVKCNKEEILNQFKFTNEIKDLQFFDINDLPKNCLFCNETIKNLKSHIH
jgi:8-oxo-dGTP pyrophosphatase MutT (NUDIX family)